MADEPVDVVRAEGDRLVFHLRGEFNRRQATDLWREAMRALNQKTPPAVTVDFSQVTGIDSAGIAFLRALQRECEHQNIVLSERNASGAVGEFLAYVREHSVGRREGDQPRRDGFVERVGAAAAQRLRTAGRLAEFLGACSATLFWVVARPPRWRLREVSLQVQRVGSEAMPLVAGLSFLMGVIMAFQALTSLENFGAYIYIADVVTISTTREMAPLLTAVIIAGRSGSAFAAEIGTMKINEEIDALAVMGFDIPQFLVIPRVLALLVATPLLTMLANAMGILGGMAMGTAFLHISPLDYFSEVNKVLTGTQIYSGLIKGFGFGGLIGLAGCFQGLQAGAAAEEVGVQTTAAVVDGILLIVIADAVYSAIFQIYGW